MDASALAQPGYVRSPCQWLFLLLLSIAALLFCSFANAVPVSYQLSFETQDQSIWDTGESTQLSVNKFLGAQWEDQTVAIDLMAGDADSSVINPLRTTYDVAMATCRLVNSYSTCVNGQTGQVYVPKLGSRPSIRSCGKYDVGCQIARAADYTRRASYDSAMKACTALGNSASVCRNGQSARLPVPALGAAPAQYLTVDTRTGVAVDGTLDGKVGLELGVAIDSGSVDAEVSYQASLDIPDTSGMSSGATINFNPDSLLAGVNTLQTTFSSVEVNVDAVMQLSGAVSAEACVLVAGCASGVSPININQTAPVFSFNEDGEGGIKLLGQSPSLFGLPAEANGFPYSVDIGGLAEVDFFPPA